MNRAWVVLLALLLGGLPGSAAGAQQKVRVESPGVEPGTIKPDDSGERLFVLWNGAFVEYDPNKSSDTFGQCSVMVGNIPASERAE